MRHFVSQSLSVLGCFFCLFDRKFLESYFFFFAFFLGGWKLVGHPLCRLPDRALQCGAGDLATWHLAPLANKRARPTLRDVMLPCPRARNTWSGREEEEEEEPPNFIPGQDRMSQLK